MDSDFQFRARVHPILSEEPRPLWSVMIPTYHCARFLKETLSSVLQQDPGPEKMQIEVIDDCSTQDDPEAVVREIGQGRISFHRQPANVGHTRNFETCLQRSRGILVHLLHGDDCVRDGFYPKMQKPFEDRPEIGAAFCRFISMDENSHWQSVWPAEQPESGLLENWLEKIASGQRLQPPSMVVRREVYEALGGFDRRLSWTEDWEMWTRIAANYPIWYEVEPLALYRVHRSSNTGRYSQTGETIRDTLRAIEIIRAYLPEDKSGRIASQAQESSALAALRRARRMIDAGEMQGPLALAREALRCTRTPAVLSGALFLYLFWIWTALRPQKAVRQL